MALHGGATDRELDGDKYYGGAPAALKKQVAPWEAWKRASAWGPLCLWPSFYYFFFPKKVTFTVGVSICHQLRTLLINVSACEHLSVSFCAALGNPWLLVTVWAINLKGLFFSSLSASTSEPLNHMEYNRLCVLQSSVGLPAFPRSLKTGHLLAKMRVFSLPVSICSETAPSLLLPVDSYLWYAGLMQMSYSLSATVW